MRAILRAESGRLWISTGEAPFEVPEFTVTGPTDTGPRREPPPEDPIEDRATDEVSRSVLLRLAPALPPARRSPDSLPPILEPTPERVPVPVAPPARAADDSSTGRFESWDWDEADPLSTGEYPLALPEVPERSAGRHDPFLAPATGPVTDPARPSLAVVRSAPAAADEEYAGLRAEPLPPPPRPVPGSLADQAWPPRAFRPAAEVPPWVDPWREDTRVVIDPTLRAPGPSPVVVAMLDAAAWAAGFVVTFGTGVITTGSAAIVLFAATL